MQLWQRRALGILTLGGGAIGFAAALGLLLSRGNPIEWLFCLLFMAAYAWGVWCGMRLLESQPNAERSTLKYWLIQIPTFSSPILGYFMSSGFHTTVTLQVSPFNLNANFLLGSSFNYSLMQSDKPWLIGINVFAAVIAWWLSSKDLTTAAPQNS
jgi:hypothetical protein